MRASDLVARCLIAQLVLFSTGPLPAADTSVTVVERGSLILPVDVHDADGRVVPVVGLSGIAWMGGDRYVTIMDNSRTLLEFRLRLSREGRPLEALAFVPSLLADRHDYEDVVWLPAGAGKDGGSGGKPAPRGRVIVCEEDSPGIHAFDLADGRRLATFAVPEIFRTRRGNRGFESLAIDAGGRHVWTANEEPLAADGPAVSAEAAGVVRLLRVPIVGQPGGVASACRQHAYPLDPPHRFMRVLDGEPLSGVTAIVPLGPERLLVLERSGGAGLPPFESRLYEVSLVGAEDVSRVGERLSERASGRLAKRLVWKGQLGINLEGLCLGPELVSGGRAVLGVGDNGGLGTPSRLVTFGLTVGDPGP